MNNKIISNYHTHTYLCKHANGKPIDYVLRAIELGYQEIAITDHGPLNEEIMNAIYSRRMSYEQYYENYLIDLDEAIKKYGTKIKILKGLEIEYFDSMKANYEEFLKKMDLLVLGQHYFYDNKKYCNVYNRLTDDEIKKYGQTLVRAMESGLFRIVAHPEIFAYTRKWDDVCDNVAKMIIQAAKENNVYIELNANGIRNSKRHKLFWPYKDGITNYAYPRIEFFKLVKEAHIPVIINDDSHDPSNLSDEATKETYNIANYLGLTVLNKIDL